MRLDAAWLATSRELHANQSCGDVIEAILRDKMQRVHAVGQLEIPRRAVVQGFSISMSTCISFCKGRRHGLRLPRKERFEDIELKEEITVEHARILRV